MKNLLKIVIPGTFAAFALCACGGGANGGGESTGSLNPVGTVVCDGRGVEGVVVSDGRYFTQTDADGKFRLPPNDKATHVAISSPAGYTVEVVESVPQYWCRLTAASRGNLKFELLKTEDDTRHCFFAVSDPQIRNTTEASMLGRKLATLKKDIEDVETDVPVHVMVTGDVVFNTMNMNAPSKAEFARLGVPVYYCIGNHDHELIRDRETIENDRFADNVYVSHYGPTCYSFNRGEVHYIALDDILFTGGPDDKYSIGFSDEQLDWVHGDLQYVPKSKAIVVLVHSPTMRRVSMGYGNAAELRAMLQGYAAVHIVSGHTHNNSMIFSQNIFDHNIGALCGGFWEGATCTDGTPMCYKRFEVDGTSFKWELIAADPPYRGEQFSLFRNSEIPNQLRQGGEMVINVWDWEDSWKVEVSEDGGATWITPTRMAQSSQYAYDTTAWSTFGTSTTDGLPTPARQWINCGKTDHLFYLTPSAGVTQVKVRVTTRFGREHTRDVEV